MPGTLDALFSHDRVRAARAHIERSDEATLARQAALPAIPAPTGAEAARGARVAELLDEAGLQDVEIDEVGNGRGWHGDGRRDHEAWSVMLTPHHHTVFLPH